MYSVKEIFPTLQGEGAQAGRAAVFLRFAGCNPWSAGEPLLPLDDPATGFIADLGQVERACLEARALPDHRRLNEIEGLAKPSLEYLRLWLWGRLSPAFPKLAHVTLRRDSCGQACTCEGPGCDG